MTTPGRNDPCRCGSGKKYKKCCLEADRAAASERLRIDAVTAKLSDVQSPRFGLDAPTPAAADRWLGDEAGARPVALDGLTLGQYARLLHHEPTVDGLALADGRPDPDSAAWAEGLVRLAPRLAVEPVGEAAFLLRELLATMPAGQGLALTRSNLLPRATVRAIAAAHAAAFPDSLHGPGGPIAVETDFAALHSLRLAAEDAGLLELEDGVLSQTPSALAAAERCGLRETWPRLLRAHATTYDWAYVDDGLPEAPSVQDAWLVGLRLVARHGGLEAERLGRALTVASAEAVHEVMAETNAPDADPEAGYDGTMEEAIDLTTTAFVMRLLIGFAELFGLATLEEADGGSRLAPDGTLRMERLEVRPSAQLADAVRFDASLLEGPDVLLAGALPDELEAIDEAVLVEAVERWGEGIGLAVPADPAPDGETVAARGPAPGTGNDVDREAGDDADGRAPENPSDPRPDGTSSEDASSDGGSSDGVRRRSAHAAAAAAERRRRRR